MQVHHRSLELERPFGVVPSWSSERFWMFKGLDTPLSKEIFYLVIYQVVPQTYRALMWATSVDKM